MNGGTGRGETCPGGVAPAWDERPGAQAASSASGPSGGLSGPGAEAILVTVTPKNVIFAKMANRATRISSLSLKWRGELKDPETLWAAAREESARDPSERGRSWHWTPCPAGGGDRVDALNRSESVGLSEGLGLDEVSFGGIVTLGQAQDLSPSVLV